MQETEAHAICKKHLKIYRAGLNASAKAFGREM